MILNYLISSLYYISSIYYSYFYY